MLSLKRAVLRKTKSDYRERDTLYNKGITEVPAKVILITSYNLNCF